MADQPNSPVDLSGLKSLKDLTAPVNTSKSSTLDVDGSRKTNELNTVVPGHVPAPTTGVSVSAKPVKVTSTVATKPKAPVKPIGMKTEPTAPSIPKPTPVSKTIKPQVVESDGTYKGSKPRQVGQGSEVQQDIEKNLAQAQANISYELPDLHIQPMLERAYEARAAKDELSTILPTWKALYDASVKDPKRFDQLVKENPGSDYAVFANIKSGKDSLLTKMYSQATTTSDQIINDFAKQNNVTPETLWTTMDQRDFGLRETIDRQLAMDVTEEAKPENVLRHWSQRTGYNPSLAGSKVTSVKKTEAMNIADEAVNKAINQFDIKYDDLKDGTVGLMGVDPHKDEQVAKPGETGYYMAQKILEAYSKDGGSNQWWDSIHQTNRGSKQFINSRSQELLSRWGVKAGDANHDLKARQAVDRAILELAAAKTVGLWSAPIMLPNSQNMYKEDVELSDALVPNVEVVGVALRKDGSAHVVRRNEGAGRYLFNTISAPEPAVAGASRVAFDDVSSKNLDKAKNQSTLEKVATGIAGGMLGVPILDAVKHYQEQPVVEGKDRQLKDITGLSTVERIAKGVSAGQPKTIDEMKSRDVEDRAKVLDLWDAAKVGLLSRDDFMSASLDSAWAQPTVDFDFTTDQPTIHRSGDWKKYVAGVGGLALSLVSPDLLGATAASAHVAGSGYKLVRDAKNLKVVDKLLVDISSSRTAAETLYDSAKDLAKDGQIEEANNARLKASAVFQKSKVAEGELRTRYPLIADHLDRVDAEIAARIGEAHPEIFDEDLAKGLSFDDAEKARLTLHPSERRAALTSGDKVGLQESYARLYDNADHRRILNEVRAADTGELKEARVLDNTALDRSTVESALNNPDMYASFEDSMKDLGVKDPSAWKTKIISRASSYFDASESEIRVSIQKNIDEKIKDIRNRMNADLYINYPEEVVDVLSKKSLEEAKALGVSESDYRKMWKSLSEIQDLNHPQNLDKLTSEELLRRKAAKSPFIESIVRISRKIDNLNNSAVDYDRADNALSVANETRSAAAAITRKQALEQFGRLSDADRLKPIASSKKSIMDAAQSLYPGLKRSEATRKVVKTPLLPRLAEIIKTSGLGLVQKAKELYRPELSLTKSGKKFAGQIETAFGLTHEQAVAVGIVSDAHARAWAEANSSTVDEWYKTRIADVIGYGEEKKAKIKIRINELRKSDEYQEVVKHLNSVKAKQDKIEELIKKNTKRLTSKRTEKISLLKSELEEFKKTKDLDYVVDGVGDVDVAKTSAKWLGDEALHNVHFADELPKEVSEGMKSEWLRQDEKIAELSDEDLYAIVNREYAGKRVSPTKKVELPSDPVVKTSDSIQQSLYESLQLHPEINPQEFTTAMLYNTQNDTIISQSALEKRLDSYANQDTIGLMQHVKEYQKVLNGPSKDKIVAELKELRTALAQKEIAGFPGPDTFVGYQHDEFAEAKKLYLEKYRKGILASHPDGSPLAFIEHPTVSDARAKVVRNEQTGRIVSRDFPEIPEAAKDKLQALADLLKGDPLDTRNAQDAYQNIKTSLERLGNWQPLDFLESMILRRSDRKVVSEEQLTSRIKNFSKPPTPDTFEEAKIAGRLLTNEKESQFIIDALYTLRRIREKEAGLDLADVDTIHGMLSNGMITKYQLDRLDKPVRLAVDRIVKQYGLRVGDFTKYASTVSKEDTAEEAAKKLSQTAWFHGTRNGEAELKVYNPSIHNNSGNLFGSGLYMTDDPETAIGYAKGMPGSRNTTPALKNLRVNLQRTLVLDGTGEDLLKRLPESVVKNIKNPDELERLSSEDAFRKIMDWYDEGHGGNFDDVINNAIDEHLGTRIDALKALDVEASKFSNQAKLEEILNPPGPGQKTYSPTTDLGYLTIDINLEKMIDDTIGMSNQARLNSLDYTVEQRVVNRTKIVDAWERLIGELEEAGEIKKANLLSKELDNVRKSFEATGKMQMILKTALERLEKASAAMNLQEDLINEGFDSLWHKGGQWIGDRNHNVIVVFDPNANAYSKSRKVLEAEARTIVEKETLFQKGIKPKPAANRQTIEIDAKQSARNRISGLLKRRGLPEKMSQEILSGADVLQLNKETDLHNIWDKARNVAKTFAQKYPELKKYEEYLQVQIINASVPYTRIVELAPNARVLMECTAWVAGNSDLRRLASDIAKYTDEDLKIGQFATGRKRVAGQFTWRKSLHGVEESTKINIKHNKTVDDIAQTHIHEIAHYTTIPIMIFNQAEAYGNIQLGERTQEAVLKINGLYHEAEKRLGYRSDLYGLKKPEEFAAEALSNPVFRRELDDVGLLNETSKVLEELQAATKTERAGRREAFARAVEKVETELEEFHKTQPETNFEWSEAHNNLYQDIGSAPKAAVQFLQDQRAIIHAFESSDISSAFHELGHIVRRDLPELDQQVINAWVGESSNIWSVESEEKFARGFERYLHDGIAPTSLLKRTFEKVKAWMREIYSSLTGSDIDMNIPDDVRVVYDRLLGKNTSTSNTLETLSKPSIPSFTDELSLQAAKQGIDIRPEAIADKLFNDGFIEFPTEVLGQKRWTVEESSKKEFNLESKADYQHAPNQPQLSFDSKNATIVTDNPVDALRAEVANTDPEKMSGKIARASMFVMMGGDPEETLRYLPGAVRKNIVAATRIISGTFSDTMHLVSEGNPKTISDYLGGLSVKFRMGRNVPSSGYNYMSNFFNDYRKFFDGLDDKTKQLIILAVKDQIPERLMSEPKIDKAIAKALYSKNAPDSLDKLINVVGGVPRAGVGDNGRMTPREMQLLRLVMEGSGIVEAGDYLPSAFNHLDDEIALGKLTDAGKSGSAEAILVEPKDKYKLSNVLAPDDKISVQWGSRSGPESADAVLSGIESIYGPEARARAAGVFASYGSKRKAFDHLINTSTSLSASDEGIFKAYMNGENLPEDLQFRAKEIEKKFGIGPDFRSMDDYNPDVIIPAAGKSKLEGLANSQFDSLMKSKEATGVGSTGEDIGKRVLRFMHGRMTYGGFFVRQKQAFNDSLDFINNLYEIAGLRPAIAAQARTIMQNVLGLALGPVEVGRPFHIVDLVSSYTKNPTHTIEAIRSGLQVGGDFASRQVQKALGVAKYRLDVNDVLKGGSKRIRLGNRVYIAQDIKDVYQAEGVFGTFAGSVRDLKGIDYTTRSNYSSTLDKYTHLAAEYGKKTIGRAFEFPSELMEGLQERSRVGAANTFIEMGLTPRQSARLTIDALYDFAGSMSNADRNFLTKLVLPFWSFQKNANSQFLNLMFSPMGAYRMNTLSKFYRRGSEGASQILWMNNTDPYGVDPNALPPDAQRDYWQLRFQVEGYFGVGKVPDSINMQIRGLFSDQSRIYDHGQIYQFSNELEKMFGGGSSNGDEVGSYQPMPRDNFLNTSRAYQPAPDKSAESDFMRERNTVRITTPIADDGLYEATRRYYDLVNPDHPFSEVVIPQNSVDSSFDWYGQWLATGILLASHIGSNIDLLGDEDDGLDFFLTSTPLKVIVDPTKAPLTSDVIGFFAGTNAYPKRVDESLAPMLESILNVEFARTPAQSDPFVSIPGTELTAGNRLDVEDFIASKGKMIGGDHIGDQHNWVNNPMIARDTRYYAAPGVVSTGFYQSPLGELNDKFLAYKKSPLELNTPYWGEILRWARGTLGVSTSEVDAGDGRTRQAKSSEVRFESTTVEPNKQK